MKKINVKLFREILMAALAFAALLFISSCASAKIPESDFYASNIADFRTEKLSNGIPVYFKQNRGSKVVVLKMVIEGGVACYPSKDGVKLDGIEEFALDLIQHGSKNYSYEDIQSLEFNKRFSITSSGGKDYSIAGFTCIQRDLELVTEVFSDSVFNPLMTQEDFDQLYKEAEASISGKKADPSGALGIELSKVAFNNHPYSCSATVQEESLGLITLDDIKSHYESLLNPGRIKFFIVADMKVNETKEYALQLEKFFGKLQKKSWSKPVIPEFKLKYETSYIENEQAGQTGYMCGIFNCPDKNSDEYIPFAIGTLFLDDVLYKQVREKEGAVYSINSGVMGGKHLLGAISVYKANNSKDVKALIKQNVDSISESEIASKLQQYKNKYITTIFNSAQSASGIAGNMISGYETFGSETAYLKRSEKVHAVTAKQVWRAYEKYIKNAIDKDNCSWVVVSGKDSVKTFGF